MNQQQSTYDAQVDAAYLQVASRIGPGESAETVTLDRATGTVSLDFDRRGRLLGVEVLGASSLLTPETLAGLSQLG